MANLKEIRTRILSVSSTKQITSAMKMVAAAKLRKAQDNIIQLRPYADQLQEIMASLIDCVDVKEDYPYIQKRQEEKVLIVLITSNKGLCGGFNANIAKKSIELAKNDYGYQFRKNQVDFYTIGKKGYDYLKAKGYEERVVRSDFEVTDNPVFEKVGPMAQQIMDMFTKHEYDCIELVYNQFKNTAVQIHTNEVFLPFDTQKWSDGDEEEKEIPDYIIEPDPASLVVNLIPKYLKTFFYKCILESVTSEHGARMTAMHQATDNATEIIEELRLSYNKARQASITNEIIEIVSGASALKG